MAYNFSKLLCASTERLYKLNTNNQPLWYVWDYKKEVTVEPSSVEL